MPFPFADFVLYPSVVIKYSHEDDYMLSSMSPSESLNLGVSLGTPGTPGLDPGKKKAAINVNIGKIQINLWFS